jgi:predicted Zn-dependent protease
MGFFSFLGGKLPEEIESAGDKFFNAGEFGAAKLEYEKAAKKAQSRFPEKASLITRLDQKITDAKESLAAAHLANSRELIASDNTEEAMDLLSLAMELTGDEQLRTEIRNLIQAQPETPAPEEGPSGQPLFLSEEDEDHEEDYFNILIHALPEDIRAAYQSYSREFRQGYIALNNGDFETAVAQFSLAMDLPGREQPLIPLELSTALVHLDQYDRARHLLKDFVTENPEDIRAYQILCDLYWVVEDYDAAIDLIENCPAPLNESLPIQMLSGETFYQMKRYGAARDLFAAMEKKSGDNEMVSRALARTCEAMGETETARDIYARILNGCARCGVRTDPFIKQRYAELCFDCGERSQQLLNLYLSIMQEDPDNNEAYYERIYQLYEALGDRTEAARYKNLIE